MANKFHRARASSNSDFMILDGYNVYISNNVRC